MKIINTFTDSENIEYTLFNDGKFKVKVKDLDSGNVISLTIYPHEDMAVKAFELYISKVII
jgi:hypothetical protein